MNFDYDVVIVGAGPGGIYSAYYLIKDKPELKICLIEKGTSLKDRSCPVVSKKVPSCVKCRKCSIMNGFGGAGAYSDGKYILSTQYGGELAEVVGEATANGLIKGIDLINSIELGGNIPKSYPSYNEKIGKKCIENGLHLLKGSVRHLGTDLNLVLLNKLYDTLNPVIDMKFNTEVTKVNQLSGEGYCVVYNTETEESLSVTARKCIIATGRSGSGWVKDVCKDLGIETHSNRVDIGVRVELPHVVFKEITDEMYEGKIVYRTKQYRDLVRTFCMNPYGEVVLENTDGIITVNGHSYEDAKNHTENTNFALLVSLDFTEPFNNSTEYGQKIASFSNMLGDGVIVQRFGDLIRGQRTNVSRLNSSFVKPTLNTTPGDLSLVLPKRILDDIIEMIYQLDKVAPGTADDDTLLYGVEVKFYNTKVAVNEFLETKLSGLYIIGDSSGITHSLSQASASGARAAKHILTKI